MYDQKLVQALDPKIKAPMSCPNLPIGIVLAGGQSSRMGQDKAMLTFRGKTFISIARQALIDAGCTRILMSGPPRPDWNGQHVPDMFANRGPVGGMVSCIDTLAKEQTFDTLLVFVAVDTPLLSIQSLAPLVSQASLAIGARYINHPIPLVLRLTQSVYEHAQKIKQQLIAGQSCSVAAFTDFFNLDALALDKVKLMELSNINTPENWNQLNHECVDQPT